MSEIPLEIGRLERTFYSVEEPPRLFKNGGDTRVCLSVCRSVENVHSCDRRVDVDSHVPQKVGPDLAIYTTYMYLKSKQSFDLVRWKPMRM